MTSRGSGPLAAGAPDGVRTAMWYGVLGLLAAVPLLYFPSFPDLKSVVTEGATVGLLALFLAWGYRGGWASLRGATLLPPFLALLAASLISLTSAVDLFEGLRGVYRLGMGILLLVILRAALRERAELEGVTRVLVGVGAVEALIGILQFLFPEALVPAGMRAAAIGTLGNTNYLGGYLATLLPVALGVACLAERRATRLAYAAAALPMLVALVMTRARGAWFGFGVGVVALLPGLARRWGGEGRPGAWRGWALVLGAPILAFAATEAIMRPLGLSVLDRLISAVAFRDRGILDRLEWWGQGFRLVLGHPLLGVGPGNFPIAIVPYLRHVEGALNSAYWVEHPHNEFLSITYEAGLLGLAAAVWLILRGGRLIWAALGSGRGTDCLRLAVAAGLVGAAADSAFFYVFHDPTGLVVVLALLALLERLGPFQPSLTKTGFGHLPGAGTLTPSPQHVGTGLAAPAAEPTVAPAARGPGAGLAAAWIVCAGLFVAIGLRPGVSTAFQHQARDALARRDGPRGVALLRRAAAWNGRSAAAHFELGLGLLMTGRSEEAMGAFRESLRLNPLYISARNNIGYANFLLNRPEQARREYRELIALVPHYAAPYNNLGYLDLQARDFPRARTHLRRALDLFPGHADARYNLGRIALMEGNPGEAIRELEEALRLVPGPAPVWLELARAQAAAGVIESALASLAKAIAIDPGIRQEARGDARLARLWGHRAFEELVGAR